MRLICDRCAKYDIELKRLGPAWLCEKCMPIVKTRMHDKDDGEFISKNALQVARTSYKYTYSGGDIYIRDIPRWMKHALQRMAIDEECSVRDIVITALVLHIKKRGY